LHPYSNLTCIYSWYIFIPNIIWIHLPSQKINGNCHYHECEGRMDGRTSPYHNTSRFQRTYKNGCVFWLRLHIYTCPPPFFSKILRSTSSIQFVFSKAISCVFSVLRQFKIVRPTHQPEEKNKFYKL
jgi:hypothetical protein